MSGVTYALTTVVLHRSNSRYSGSTSCDARHRPARRAAAGRPRAARAPDSRTNAGGRRRRCRRPRSRIARASRSTRGLDRARRCTAPVGVEPLGDAERQRRIDERPRQRHEDVVELRPRLPADAQHVLEARGRDERDARALALEHGVGRDGRSVHDVASCAVPRQFRDAGENGARRIVGRRCAACGRRGRAGPAERSR